VASGKGNFYDDWIREAFGGANSHIGSGLPPVKMNGWNKMPEKTIK
jgi:hypothetical protein